MGLVRLRRVYEDADLRLQRLSEMFEGQRVGVRDSVNSFLGGGVDGDLPPLGGKCFRGGGRSAGLRRRRSDVLRQQTRRGREQQKITTIYSHRRRLYHICWTKTESL